MDKVYAREFGSRTVVTRLDNGDWSVTCHMMEKLKETKESEWEEVNLSSEGSGPVFDKVYEDTMNDLLANFNKLLSDNDGAGMFKKERYTDEELEAPISESPVISASEG